MQFSDPFRRWMGQHGASYLRPIVTAIDRQSATFVRSSAAYQQHVVAEAIAAAPLQLRLLDPTYAEITGFLLEARDQFFDARGTAVLLRPDWADALTQFSPGSTSSASPMPQAAGGTPAPAGAHGVAARSDTAANQQTAATQKRQDTLELAPLPEDAEVVPDRAAPAPAAAPAQAVAVPVGIDLGTTYSVIAHLDEKGRPTSIPNSNGDLLTPSVVLFDDDGVVVGKEAVLAAALEPDRVADCVKRDMGGKYYHKPIRGELLPPEVISSFVLRRLKQDAELKLGPITKAVITVPAYFDETRRRATMDAGRLAGLDVLDIVNEPTAAAIAYGYQAGYLDADGHVKGDRPVRILVYDLGGGTFDVTIVEMSGQMFRALATDGDVRLGGKDWDEKLIDMLAEAFRLKHGADPRASADTLQALWTTAEAAKRTLSERSKTTAIINHGATRFKMEVTRQQFEEATAPLVLRTRTTTEIVLLQSGLGWKDIDKVLLVGGSTRMPTIVKMITELSGKQPERSVSADEAVAHGAALYADMLLKRNGLGPGHTAFTVTNINSHSLGIAGLDPRSGRRVTTVLIPKNTALPHAASRRFRTAKAGQVSVRICVLEGESELPEGCVEVGVATVRGLPPNLPAGWPVEVSYSYGEGGRLQVSGQLVGHEAAVNVEFARDNSLTDDDLLLWAECLNAEAARQSLDDAQAGEAPGGRSHAHGLAAATRRAGAAADSAASEKALRVLRGDKIYGPMTRPQVVQLLAEGRLQASDLVCAIDSPWMPLSSFVAPAAQAAPYSGLAAGPVAVVVPVTAAAAGSVPVAKVPPIPGKAPSLPAASRPAAGKPAASTSPPSESELMELTLADLDEDAQSGVDLLKIPQAPRGAPAVSSSLLEDLEDNVQRMSTKPEWYVKIRGMTACHLSTAQLKSLVVAREIHADSPVCNINWDEGSWRPFRAVHELAELWKFLSD